MVKIIYFRPLNYVRTPSPPVTNSLNNWEANKIKKHRSRKEGRKEVFILFFLIVCIFLTLFSIGYYKDSDKLLLEASFKRI